MATNRITRRRPLRDQIHAGGEGGEEVKKKKQTRWRWKRISNIGMEFGGEYVPCRKLLLLPVVQDTEIIGCDRFSYRITARESYHPYWYVGGFCATLRQAKRMAELSYGELIESELRRIA